ncbi:19759_t:CDS:2, partial [Gigaspora rosea]
PEKRVSDKEKNTYPKKNTENGTYIPNNEAWEPIAEITNPTKRKTPKVGVSDEEKKNTSIQKKTPKTTKRGTYISTENDVEAWNLSLKLRIPEPER